MIGAPLSSGCRTGLLGLCLATIRDKLFALAIESSNPSAREGDGAGGPGVALAEISNDAGSWTVRGPIVTEMLRQSAAREDDLMSAVDRVTRATAVSPRQIGLVAVSVGPGGFTALRVAVTVGNAVAFTTGAPCVSVPSALVAAKHVESSGRFAVALASKGQTTFATVFEPGWDEARRLDVPAGRLVHASDIAGLEIGLLVADRYLPATIRDAAAQSGVPIAPPVFEPARCLELACLLRAERAGSLLPMYPREPEAVTLWKARPKP